MLAYFKDMTDFDVLFWLPTDKEDVMKVESCRYKIPGEQIGGSKLGPEYHIVVFKFDNKTGTYEHDSWDAILSDPRVYVSGLIPQSWYGFVARKTTESQEFVDDILDKIKNI
jgi:hypothetical protein